VDIPQVKWVLCKFFRSRLGCGKHYTCPAQLVVIITQNITLPCNKIWAYQNDKKNPSISIFYHL